MQLTCKNSEREAEKNKIKTATTTTTKIKNKINTTSKKNTCKEENQ